jgi:NitT/TauT family transport system substrate-binding protein
MFATRLLAVACLGALVAAGCGRDDREITVGALPITDLAQLFVADAKGFFADEGLKVKITDFGGGAEIVPAVQSGSVDIGWSNSISILQAHTHGLDMRFFAGGLYQGPGHWNSALMVPDGSPIHSADRLRGSRVAVNTLGNLNELVLRAYLDRAGERADAAEVLEVPFPDQPAALDARRVDAALPAEPFVTMAARGGAVAIDREPFTVLGAKPFVAAFFATGDWLREHADTAAAFRRAIDRATRYWNEHPAERAGIIARYTKVPAPLARQIAYGLPSTRIAPGDVQRLIGLAHRYGLLAKTFDAREVLAR